MRTATSTFQNTTTGEFNPVTEELTPAVRARRARQRRQMLAMMGASYALDSLLLLLFVRAGTISATVDLAFAALSLGSVLVFAALSDAGVNDRFKDHYFVLPQAFVSLTIVLVFTYIAPEVGFLFLCALFVIFSFSALRSTPFQTVMSWAAMTIGVSGLFLLTDKAIAMPHGSLSERVATALALVLTIGRCMYIGIFANSLRDSLYKRGIELKAAYKRIEELAELDDLTGAFNRRCIMRMLDSEIIRAQRSKLSFSVALIDLDWFKRINDAYGHPTGDEVLRTFAITMFANIRLIDRFGRYGGEEFLLILPETSNDDAVRSLDRLREIVARLDWSAFDAGMSVTISAGVATLAVDETPEALLARADSALYAAKARGRNLIASA